MTHNSALTSQQTVLTKRYGIAMTVAKRYAPPPMAISVVFGG